MKAGLTRGTGLVVAAGGVKRSSSHPLLSDWPVSPGLDRKEVGFPFIGLLSLLCLWVYRLFLAYCFPWSCFFGKRGDCDFVGMGGTGLW
jgi:hypothetical protein